MLHNDITRNDKMDTVHARDLQNAVLRHHQNNPHVSMEAAFVYIMSISSTYRALPIECIEKARRYLDLPIVGIKPKEVTSEYNPSLFLVTQDKITPIGWRHIISDNSADTLEAPGEPKPGTTVVHAERVVVDNKKMIKILKFENVAYMKDLPDRYLSEAPTFYKCDPPRNIKANVMFHEQIDSSNTLSYSISHGNTISIKEFGQMIKTMKEAGARLTKINKTAKLEKEHSGEFTVSI